MTDVDLAAGRKRVHIVGIGGAGMSAMATVLVGMGHVVSGSDRQESAALERLRRLGVTVAVGHDGTNVGTVDLLATSTAVSGSNSEVLAALARGVPVVRRADLLAGICACRRTLAVAGTHGKTTTSTLAALALGGAGLDPGFVIGGEVVGYGSGARWSDSDWFVVEADESDGTFLELPRAAAIVTNVEADHLEHYGTFEALRRAFERFVAETDGPVVVCADDPVAAGLASQAPSIVTYGTGPAADYRMTDVEPAQGEVRWRVQHHGEDLGAVRLPTAGRHNAATRPAALAAASELGAPWPGAVDGIEGYRGVGRRFEFRGAAAGVTFIDDYAHLPTEVRAALDAARDGGWGRIVCVFQPHRYSRTEALWRQFADAFEAADLLVVTDVYPAGEAARPGVSGKLVVDAVLDAHPRARVAWLPARHEIVAYLTDRLRGGDLCLTLGVGDLTTLPDEMVAGLRNRVEPRR